MHEKSGELQHSAPVRYTRYRRRSAIARHSCGYDRCRATRASDHFLRKKKQVMPIATMTMMSRMTSSQQRYFFWYLDAVCGERARARGYQLEYGVTG
jgi:hypothetical protein